MRFDNSQRNSLFDDSVKFSVITSNVEPLYPMVEPMNEPMLYDLSSKRQLYDLIYHQESMQGGKPLEINEFEEVFDQLDVEKLKAAYEYVLKRHDGLRTVFRLIDGKIKQEIHPYSHERFFIIYADLSDLEESPKKEECEALADKVKLDFGDVQKGPLAQGLLFRMNDERYLFRFLCHHILSDGYSMKLLYTELKAVYESLITGTEISLPPVELTCREFLLERNKLLNGRYEEKLYAYWEKKLQEHLVSPDVRVLYRNFLHRPGIQIPSAEAIAKGKKNMPFTQWWSYTTAFDNKNDLTVLSSSLGVTPNVVLIGVFFACVHVVYQTTKTIAVSTIPGRNDKVSKQIFGNLFCNIFMKSECHADMTLKEVMMKVYMDFLQSCRYPIFEFHKLDPFETRERCEFFVNFLDLNDTKDIALSYSENYVHKHDKEYYSLSYIVNEYKNGFTFRWAYQEDIYTPRVIECLAESHLAVLRQFLNTPDMTMGELEAYLLKEGVVSK